jgi:hypothetical protein
MNISKLYLKLSPADREIATDVIQSIGIGISVGTLDYRKSYKAAMFKHRGELRLLFKTLSRLNDRDQKKFYDTIANQI